MRHSRTFRVPGCLWDTKHSGKNHTRPFFTDSLRHDVHRMFSMTNKAPPNPPSTPVRKNANISHEIHSFLAVFVGNDKANNVSLLAPVKFKDFRVKLAEKAARKLNSKVRCDRLRTLPSSSTAKSTPPKGAPKAVATPAAAPTQANSWKGIPARRQPNAPQIRCKVDAIQTPMWMRGPSLPKESPAPTAKLKPSVLIKRQEPVKLRGKSYPETAAFTSGMPLPRAVGAYS
mmetsp:Transcript_11985/g.26426  ORF Transcript_11985/g.26426 Transcript_11985/m.26426 type:complete len:230 (-) Transcript_11985:556-1245(-)